MEIKNKSKEKIISAFLNLTSNNEYHEIGIDDIIINSRVSRGTFYNHFKSKNDILIYIEKLMCDCVDEAFAEIDPNNSNYVEIMTDKILPMVYENRLYVQILYKYYQPVFFNFLINRYSKYFIKYFDGYDENVLNLPKDFAVQFYFRMMLNAMLLWISVPFPLTPQEFKGPFKKILNSSVYDVCGLKIQ